MIRTIINVVLIILLILVSWLGLGPALFADGTDTERLYTLLTVGFIYLLIFLIMFFVNKRLKR